MATDRIRVTGKPRRDIDVDLLVQAVIAIAEQRLHAEQLAAEQATPTRPDTAEGEATA